ncbi:MAG: hypothetical protein WC692_07985 [Erythrobacter sp.]|jgi:hypothetical protein
MDWHQFLREERARKLQSIEMLNARAYTISRWQNGESRDLNDEIVADYRRHINEIEQLLTNAGVPLVADRSGQPT